MIQLLAFLLFGFGLLLELVAIQGVGKKFQGFPFALIALLLII